MNRIMSRRSFLGTAGVTVASIAVAHSDDKLPSQPKDPVSTPRMGVRVNIADLEDDSLTLASYRKAVKAMKGLQAKDPRCWTFQANMHGAPQEDGVNPGWGWCMHRNWWFLPWHRGYLYFFERIVRKLSDDDSFRLPYWAWEKPNQDVLPVPFRNAGPPEKPNPLHDPTRYAKVNAGSSVRPAGLAGTFAADWDWAKRTNEFTTAFAATAFGGLKVKGTMPTSPPDASESFGVMESRAHNLIHVGVAPQSGGNMADPDTAARDPIFWLHHANVDRLWNRWLDERGHYNPDDPDWLKQAFPFYDENGMQVTKAVEEILQLAAEAYRYDDDRRAVFGAETPPVVKGKPVERVAHPVAAAVPMLSLGTTPFSKPLTLEKDARPRLVGALRATPSPAPPVVALRVEHIQPPAKAAVVYEVFLVKEGEKPAAKYSLGPITFFGVGADHQHAGQRKGFTQAFDATDVLQALQRENKGVLPQLEVKIVPHSTNPAITDQDLAKEQIQVPISNVTLAVIDAPK